MSSPSFASRGPIVFAIVLSLWLGWTAARAELKPENVLVVYQAGAGQASDGQAIFEYYRALRPGVLGVNLAEYGVSEPFAGGTVSYVDFAAKIREPLRAFLFERGLAEQVRVIVLTKGIPHRVQQLPPALDNAGDAPHVSQGLLEERNASYASVDSELTLLWHDLDAGENGAGLDSHADNFVLNPYFQATDSLAGFDASAVANAASAQFLAEEDGDTRYWRLGGGPADAGRLYLTCRLDGNSLADVLGMIDRGQRVAFDMNRDQFLLDASSAELDQDDLAQVDEHFAQAWRARWFNNDATFLLGSNPGNLTTSFAQVRLPGPVALLSGYGVNHSGENETGWLSTYQGQLAGGAIFNTWESYNGRQFGGHGSYVSGSGVHAQLSDWITYGGTFGLGHVWEPFAFSVGRNVVLLENFLVNGLTWVESAWSSLVVLSWQNVIVGDPLAKAAVNLQPLVTMTGSRGNLEEQQSQYAIQLRVSRPFETAQWLKLRFTGAEVAKDFRTEAGILNDQGETAVLLKAGTTEVSFQVTVLEDRQQEGLELLLIDLLPSEDRNGDGFGDEYSYLAPQRAVMGLADSAYDLWRYQHFGANALAEGANEEDPDHDSLANIEEYALGRDPNKAEPHPLRTSNGGRAPALLVMPKTPPRDVRYSLQASESLEPESFRVVASKTGGAAWAGEAELSIDTSSATEDVVRIGGRRLAKQFIRLQVEALANP